MIFDHLLDPDLPAPLVWFVLVWLFAVGACIGSFMNVVIYRLPAGLSLLHPPSRCPDCETPIRATDNVPIVGWLWLRGRCRKCRARISPRYPAVELLVAIVFAGLAWVGPLSSGNNLPSSAHGLTMSQLWEIYAFHLYLACSLICAAFIEYDGHTLPTRLTVPAVILGLAAPLIWPHLRPLAGGGISEPFPSALVRGLLGVLTGAALGYAMGWTRRFVLGERTSFRRTKDHNNSAIALAWVGSFLGWQAAAGVAAVAVLTQFAMAAVGRIMPVARCFGLTRWIAVWSVVWIMEWKRIAEFLP
ncbi:MAG TPA: prepilin peptidase [Pirellulales bacterium]|nr:prepilin peptidase [Pirellulales bacterium]